MVAAVLADTHMPLGGRTLPSGCLDRLRHADLIVHAGDLVGLSVLEEIQSLGPPVVAVHGNVDAPEVRERLPAERELELDGSRLALVHDAGEAKGRLRRLRRRFPVADAVVFGHSHIPLHEAEDGFHIFNPGSPTERRRAPHHTMGMVEATGGHLRFEIVRLN